MADNGESKPSAWNNPEFRPDLAFPKLTEEMVERLLSYGREETFPANITLFTPGGAAGGYVRRARGEVEIFLPGGNGEPKIIAHHQRFDFSGELNLLTSQGSLVEARTVKREPSAPHTAQRVAENSCARRATSRT